MPLFLITGVGGVIYTLHTLEPLKELGLDTHKATRLALKLHAHSGIHGASALVKDFGKKDDDKKHDDKKDDRKDDRKDDKKDGKKHDKKDGKKDDKKDNKKDDKKDDTGQWCCQPLLAQNPLPSASCWAEHLSSQLLHCCMFTIGLLKKWRRRTGGSLLVQLAWRVTVYLHSFYSSARAGALITHALFILPEHTDLKDVLDKGAKIVKDEFPGVPEDIIGDVIGEIRDAVEARDDISINTVEQAVKIMEDILSRISTK
eukprot:1156023-Pelagomonas_calceolata.AAC.1